MVLFDQGRHAGFANSSAGPHEADEVTYLLRNAAALAAHDEIGRQDTSGLKGSTRLSASQRCRPLRTYFSEPRPYCGAYPRALSSSVPGISTNSSTLPTTHLDFALTSTYSPFSLLFLFVKQIHVIAAGLGQRVLRTRPWSILFLVALVQRCQEVGDGVR